jgi:glyoxylase-like metal-dependent hydrolase (beta-lactamase superfamily II)
MAVHEDSYYFNLGNIECLAISDGTFVASGSPPQKLPGQYQIQPGQKIPEQCLYAKINGNAILIDTGHGVGDHPNTGKLIQNLEADGLRCSDIDTVILTHAHGDHIGGNTDAKGKPMFPNARYIISEIEWEFWTSDPDLPQLDEPENIKQMFLKSVQKNLLSIRDRLDVIDTSKEIIPGIRFIQAPGHTPGLIVPVISSGTEELFCVSDLFHFPLEIEQKEVYSPFDVAPEEAKRSRFQILSQVVKNNALVFTSHFSFPGIGHVKQKDDVWLWQPIKLTTKK